MHELKKALKAAHALQNLCVIGQMGRWQIHKDRNKCADVWIYNDESSLTNQLLNGLNINLVIGGSVGQEVRENTRSGDPAKPSTALGETR